MTKFQNKTITTRRAPIKIKAHTHHDDYEFDHVDPDTRIDHLLLNFLFRYDIGLRLYDGITYLHSEYKLKDYGITKDTTIVVVPDSLIEFAHDRNSLVVSGCLEFNLFNKEQSQLIQHIANNGCFGLLNRNWQYRVCDWNQCNILFYSSYCSYNRTFYAKKIISPHDPIQVCFYKKKKYNEYIGTDIMNNIEISIFKQEPNEVYLGQVIHHTVWSPTIITSEDEIMIMNLGLEYNTYYLLQVYNCGEKSIKILFKTCILPLFYDVKKKRFKPDTSIYCCK
jgi:hypothetical protein